MKTILAIIAVLMLAGVAGAQGVEHAPTVEQCRADNAVWWDKVTADAPAPDWATTVKESSVTIALWSKELGLCMVVDPTQTHNYAETDMRIALIISSRRRHFIERHGLADKFWSEDAAGKR